MLPTAPGFPTALLDRFRCPYCDSGVAIDVDVEASEAGIRYGVIRCHCYRYPIIEGILVLQQEGPHRQGMFARATDALDRGDARAALTEVLQLPRETGPLGTAVSMLARRQFPPAVARDRARTARVIDLLAAGKSTFADAARLLRIPSYADYLIHRYANPSFLGAIPLLQLFGLLQNHSERPLRVLDLGCGTGHASYLISRLLPKLELVCADHDFSNLFLAKHYFAPNATCICLDLQLPFPFEDNFASGVLCLDALHYINAKVSFLKEVDRVCTEDALWVFPHLHNRLHDVAAPGVPLAPVDYTRLFSVKEGTLLSERRILEGFTRGVLELGPNHDPAALDSVENLSFVGGKAAELWGKRQGLVDQLLISRDDLAINPLFDSRASGEGVVLTASWPNPNLERECAEAKDFLPAECVVPASLLQAIGERDLTADEREAARSLLLQFLVVPVPPRYGAGSRLSPGSEPEAGGG